MTITVLAQSNTAASHTGSTVETVLATVTLPANTLSANGSLRVTPLFSKSGTAGTAQVKVRFGGTSGTLYLNHSVSATTTLDQSGPIYIRANNATNAQKGFPATNIAQQGAVTNAMVTSAEDTTANVDIVFSAQLGNAADTVSLEGYTIEQIEP